MLEKQLTQKRSQIRTRVYFKKIFIKNCNKSATSNGYISEG